MSEVNDFVRFNWRWHDSIFLWKYQIFRNFLLNPILRDFLQSFRQHKVGRPGSSRNSNDFLL